jgi:hypothetical protein
MMKARWLVIPSALACGMILTIAACSATSDAPFGKGQNGSGGTAGQSNQGGSGGMFLPGGGSGGGNSEVNPPCSATDPNADLDGDGYTIADGDCNDCSAKMNPGAYDFFGNNIDEDCNGIADDEPFGCDENLPLDSDDPLQAARALGLCRFTSATATGAQKTWGVISAAYVFADGSVSSGHPDDPFECVGNGGSGAPPNVLSHGLLPKFGPITPRQGSTMLALSSGIAREGVVGPSPAEAIMCTKSATPAGFPTPSSAACPGQYIDDTFIANDPMALELRIRVPTNAKSLSFDFDFYTYEYPGYICTEYNDFFVALLYSQHPNTPPNHNISFDKPGNPVSVNNGFLEVCKPGTHGKKTFQCPLGTAELMGTGFEDHAATGWLQTKTAVVPGEEITLRFAIWDMGDEILDSTVLIDNVAWDVEEGEIGTVRPPPK